MNVYFVRHGETTYNAKKLHQDGSTTLSDLGLVQAQGVAERVKNLPVKKILCSDFVRTKQTAEAILKQKPVEIEYSPLFREIKRPSEIEHQFHHDPKVKQIKQQILDHINDKNWHYSDEENYFDFISRAKQAISFIEEQTESNILVVTHGRFISSIVGLMIFEELFTPELREKVRFRWKTSNSGLTLLKKTPDYWQLATFNDHAHLG